MSSLYCFIITLILPGGSYIFKSPFSLLNGPRWLYCSKAASYYQVSKKSWSNLKYTYIFCFPFLISDVEDDLITKTKQKQKKTGQ